MCPSLLERTVDRLQGEPVNADQRKPDEGLTVGQYFHNQLAAWGVKRIYGVIGDAILYFLDDIAKQGKIQYVPFLDENAAALAATAEAKLTGRLGVVIGTSGPGLTNMLNGLADAYADGVPVLAITGQVDENKIGSHTKQYIQQQMMIVPIAAASEALSTADALPMLLHRMLSLSTVRGCVSHISVPKAMFRDKVKGAVFPYSSHYHQPLLAPEKEIDETFAFIAGAKRPFFLMGRGVEGLTQEAVELSETLGAAVAATMPGMSFFPGDHKQFTGGLGLAGSEASSALMAESDLVVIFGATWWPQAYTPPNARIVQIDVVKENIGMSHPLARGLVGDLRAILPRFLELSKRLGELGSGDRGSERNAWLRRIAQVRGDWRKRMDEEAAQSLSPLAPQRIMRIISECVAADAVIALDTGDHTLWFNRAFDNRGQRVLVSGRWRTLGFGLPAAIAAQLAYPNRQVVAIAGDGGVVQTLMEFRTAVNLQLPITLIVLNNASYAIEKHRMELEGLSSMGSLLVNPDFAAIARACGGAGYAASTPEELRSALRETLAEHRPSLIEVSTAQLTVPHTKL